MDLKLCTWNDAQSLMYYRRGALLFFRSFIKFQGHTGWKIHNLNPIWVRLLGRSQLWSPSDLQCWQCDGADGANPSSWKMRTNSCQCRVCGGPGDTRSQGISRYVIDIQGSYPVPAPEMSMSSLFILHRQWPQRDMEGFHNRHRDRRMDPSNNDELFQR